MSSSFLPTRHFKLALRLSATKPKRMQWRTYNKHVERFDAYEAILGRGVAELLASFSLNNSFRNQWPHSSSRTDFDSCTWGAEPVA